MNVERPPSYSSSSGNTGKWLVNEVRDWKWYHHVLIGQGEGFRWIQVLEMRLLRMVVVEDRRTTALVVMFFYST